MAYEHTQASRPVRVALACGGLLGVLIVGADALFFQPPLPELFARTQATTRFAVLVIAGIGV